MANVAARPPPGTFKEVRVLSVYDRRLAFERDEVQELYPLARAWAANDPASVLNKRTPSRSALSVNRAASSDGVDPVTQLQHIPVDLPPLLPSTPNQPARAPKAESNVSADDILPKYGKMSRDEEDAFRRRIKEQFVRTSRGERKARAQAYAAATAPQRARLAQLVPNVFGPDAAPVPALQMPDLVPVAPMAAVTHHRMALGSAHGQGQGAHVASMQPAGGRGRGGRAAGAGRGRGGKGRAVRDSSYEMEGVVEQHGGPHDPSSQAAMAMGGMGQMGMMQYEHQHVQGMGVTRRGARSSHPAMSAQYYTSLQPYEEAAHVPHAHAHAHGQYHPQHQGGYQEAAGYDVNMQWAQYGAGAGAGGGGAGGDVGWGEEGMGPDFLAMLQSAAEDGTMRGSSPVKQERGATPAQGGSGDRGQGSAVHSSGGSTGRAQAAAQAAALVRLTSGVHGSPSSGTGSAPRMGAQRHGGSERTGGSPSADGIVASTPAHGTHERPPVSSGGQGSEGSAQRALESMTSPGGAALPQLAELLAGFGDMPT